MPLIEDRSEAIAQELRSWEHGGDGKLGCGLLDFDHDDDLDLYLANGPTESNLLWRNDGAFVFTDVAAEVGAAVGTGSSGVLAADLDGDGWTDLVLAGDPSLTSVASTPLVVLRNVGGTFVDVSAGTGIVPPTTHLGASAGDVDQDGDLDLFVVAPGSFATGEQHANQLWRNDGGLAFTEIGVEAGVATAYGACASTFTHLDEDDTLDLLVADCNDTSFATTPLEVLRNDGTGRFTDALYDSRVWTLGYWMGLAVADFDGDGRLDFFSTNLGVPDFPHVLWTANGDGTYTDRGPEAGVADWEYGWGTVAFDVDADTDLDLYYVGTSHAGATPGGFTRVSPGRLFLNRGDGTFDPPEVPVDLSAWSHSGLCEGDLDGDGFADLVVVVSADPRARSDGYPRLLRATGTANHTLSVRLAQEGANPAGIGARIRATAGGTTMLRELQAGSSFVSTSSPWPTFGLGAATEAQVCVRWPDGVGEDFGTFAADQRVDLVRGAGLGETPCSRGAVEVGDPPLPTGTTSSSTPTTEDDDGPGRRPPRAEGCSCGTSGGPGWLAAVGALVLAGRRHGRAVGRGRARSAVPPTPAWSAECVGASGPSRCRPSDRRPGPTRPRE